MGSPGVEGQGRIVAAGRTPGIVGASDRISLLAGILVRTAFRASPMNLLAIDTSTEYLSLALSCNGQVRDLHRHAGQRHAEIIYAEIRTLLRQAGLVMKDLQGIAFARGPGSFTGVRIACGVTQGLAFALSVKVKGVSTLEALAEEAHANFGAQRVIACLDARMGEVYHAACVRNADGGWTLLEPPRVCSPDAVPAVQGNDWTGCGNGFAVHGEALGACYASNLAQVRADLYPTARAVLALARPALETGKGDAPAEALPLYVRNKVALTTSERAARRAG